MNPIKIVLGKAEVYEACIFSKYNIDTTTGCACGKDNPNDRCAYCYAKLWNRFKYAPKVIPNNIDQKLENLDPVWRGEKYIRIGKMTDPGYEIQLLKNLITKMTEHHTHAVIVTKLLKFDEEMAKLLVKNGATLHFSLGVDKLEPGACKLGMNNANRIKHGKLYAKAGVNVAFRSVIDVTQPIPERERRLAEEGYSVLVTPIRVRDKTFVKDINNYKYFRGYYRPNFIHESFKKNKNIRFCGELSDGTPLCGMCFVDRSK